MQNDDSDGKVSSDVNLLINGAAEVSEGDVRVYTSEVFSNDGEIIVDGNWKWNELSGEWGNFRDGVLTVRNVDLVRTVEISAVFTYKDAGGNPMRANGEEGGRHFPRMDKTYVRRIAGVAGI